MSSKIFRTSSAVSEDSLSREAFKIVGTGICHEGDEGMNSSAISTASAEGRARIAETHAAVASAIFVAFPLSLRDRKRLSSTKNVPIPPKTLRHATAHPATASIHEEAAIAAPEASAIPTAKRTLAVVFQTARARSSLRGDFDGASSRTGFDENPKREKNGTLAEANMAVRKVLETLARHPWKNEEKLRKNSICPLCRDSERFFAIMRRFSKNSK